MEKVDYVMLCARVSVDLRNLVREQADRLGVSMQEFVRDALEREVDRVLGESVLEVEE